MASCIGIAYNVSIFVNKKCFRKCGNQDEEAVKKASILQEKTKAKYPFLIPDTTMLNGRLQGISAFPETFFVEKDGNIVGDTYTGSHTLDEWKEIVEKELKNVSK